MSSEEILAEINREHPKPVAYQESQMVEAFGFKHVSSQEVLFRQLLRPSLTDKQICTASPFDIAENIPAWCGENKIHFYYDPHKNLFIFSKQKP